MADIFGPNIRTFQVFPDVVQDRLVPGGRVAADPQSTEGYKDPPAEDQEDDRQISQFNHILQYFKHNLSKITIIEMGCCRVGPILTTVFPEITRTEEWVPDRKIKCAEG